MTYKEIPEFSGYFAGDDGHIYSNHPRRGEVGVQPLRQLKANIQSTGRYLILGIKKDGAKKYCTKTVHRLICITFHGLPRDSSFTVSHLDGNWKNNRPENLRWESYSENLCRKKDHGTDDVGVKNTRSLINLETLAEIRRLLNLGAMTHEQIGDKFNLQRAFISKIANGSRYKNQGNF